MIPNAHCDTADEMSEGKSALTHPKLKEADAIRALCTALPERIAEHMLYAQILSGTLTIYLGHPALVAEFEGSKEKTLEKMREIYKEQHFSKVIWFSKVVGKYKHRALEREETQEPDSSSGVFDIKAIDPDITRRFRAIQARILESHVRR